MVPARPSDWRDLLPVALLVGASGLAASIGQIVLLRELLVFFSGNELSSGMVFASWLICTAGGSLVAWRFTRHRPVGDRLLLPTFISASLTLPVSLLWVRAARAIWSIAPGEVPTPLSMFAVSVSSMAVFCFLSGGLFALAWQSVGHLVPDRPERRLVVYLAEALGAALGGISFYFLFMPKGSLMTATASVAVSCVILGAVVKFLPCGGFRDKRAAVTLFALGAVLAAAFQLWGGRLDRVSRGWQWGPRLIEARDTPFQHLAILKNADQFSLFANGSLLFSVPDPQTAENAVHLTLLQHEAPQSVLLMGGGMGGLLEEILKHPTIRRVDYLEADPGLIELAREILPAAAASVLDDHRVQLQHLDAAGFVRTVRNRYDVILMNLGDPVNVETNRFYTLEFFKRLSDLLDFTGIFSFSITASPNILGPMESRLLKSLYLTLRSVFPEVTAMPAERILFHAAHSPGVLTTDPHVLIQRSLDRRLPLQYLHDYSLYDTLNPLRLRYLQAVLQEGLPARVNKAFQPVCHVNYTLAWSAQVSPSLSAVLAVIWERGPRAFWLTTGLLLLGACISRWSGILSTAAAIRINVLMIGGIQMIQEVALLVAFQILEGLIYKQLALLIAFFMAGMAVGAAATIFPGPGTRSPRRFFMAIQATLALHLLVIVGFIEWFQDRLHVPLDPPIPAVILFALLAFISGSFGGLHFGAGVRALSADSSRRREGGPALYALDLLGATLGVMLGTLFIIPIYGVAATMWGMAMVAAGGVLVLLRIRT